jgi:putative ABC transport system permease protein
MLKNYLKIAFRSLRKNRVISFINTIGLAIGIAVCLLILLFCHDELGYDRYNVHADRVYRIVKDFVNDDGSRLPDATTPGALAPAMQKELPEVAYATRVFPSWGSKYRMRVGDKSFGDKTFMEERLFRVDSNFFEVFTVPFVEGNAKDAFRQLNSIVLTQSMAKKYFGDKDPMDKLITTDMGDLKVTGVVKDVPAAAHMHYDFLVSIRKLGGDIDGAWGWYNFYTYVRLKPGTNIATVVPKVQALYHKNDKDGKNIFYAQALTDIHLRSDLKWEIEPNSNILYVYVFSVIGLFVIAIACVNYINLSTAKAALRAKEIGVRKVSGALRGALIGQFLTESMVTVIFAFLLGLTVTQLLLSPINQLVQKDLSLATLLRPDWLLVTLAGIGLIGLAAGIYPALYLSGIKPVLVLKGLRLPEGSVFNLRKTLVVFQFTISIALITGTAIVVQQINYIQHAKLGLNKDQVMIVDAPNIPRSTMGALETEFRGVNGVGKVAAANGVIGGLNWTTSMKSKGSQNSQLINFIGINYDYLDVLGIQIKEGRNFSAAYPTDTTSNGIPGTTERQAGSIILNETAIRDLGIPEPAVGRQVQWGKDHDTTYYLRIVGVAKDFHFASFRSAIKPFGFLMNNPDWRDNLTLKVAPAELGNTIAQLQRKWNAVVPGQPFKYAFLDDTFSKLYQSDQRFNKIIAYLTVLAIAIGCMGLFGLTAFMIERRTKEIGVRKVIGATPSGIVVLLSRDFVKLVLLAVVIATPIAWYSMTKWLDNFAYRVSIQWWVFVAAGAAAVLIALVTVSFQAVKAAMDNPVRALRSE